MKYIFLLFCFACVQSITAQSNPFRLIKGDTVYFRILTEYEPPVTYDLQVPLYVVGTIVELKRGVVTVNPIHYLYTCSAHAQAWVKSPTLVYERQNYFNEPQSTETWNAATQPHQHKKIALVFPYTAQALEVLTRGTYTTACTKVVAKNKVKPRTR